MQRTLCSLHALPKNKRYASIVQAQLKNHSITADVVEATTKLGRPLVKIRVPAKDIFIARRVLTDLPRTV